MTALATAVGRWTRCGAVDRCLTKEVLHDPDTGLTHIHLVVRDLTLNEDASEAQVAGVSGGVSHFGFRLTEASDLDAAIAEVEAAGGKLIQRGEHAPGAPFAYVRDPDGYVIEFLP